MDYNFHTHTYRCRHAKDTEEEYIRCAIEGGIRHMGFADHAPLRFADGFESTFRVPVDSAREYCETIAALREKYKGKIELYIGFEMEYFSEMFEEMLANVCSYGAEYLILGQHYYAPEHPHGSHSFQPHSDPADMRAFAASLVEAMGKGVFTYVAHPDMFRYTGDPAVYKEESRRICIAARETDTPLEINFLGIRDNRIYPNEDFWQIAGEEQSPVTFGFDAHDAPAACDRASLPRAMELVEKYNLRYIGMPKLRPLG